MALPKYDAYAVTFSSGTVTVTSGTAVTSAFSITDTTGTDTADSTGKILGTSEPTTHSALTTSATVGGGSSFTYEGVVALSTGSGTVTGLLVFDGTNYFFLARNTALAPLTSASSTLIAADSSNTSSQWDTSIVGQACFLEGTLIATGRGDVAVEDLKAGDLVVTASGAAVPVRFVGYSTVSTVFADPAAVLPVRLLAGSLGENLPVRDLIVSPAHALVLGGTLVQAGALVNGTTILRDIDAPKVFTYYHIELDHHDVILAEGVPAESFTGGVEEIRFDNAAERPAQLVQATELAMPRVKSARQVPEAVRVVIAARAAVIAPAVAIAA